MVKRLLFTILTVTLFPAAKSQSWIDVTDDFIVNPRYEGNDLSSGWMGTGLGAANPHENAEHYSKNYNTYQEISGLTPGKYRLSLDAFYRMGNSSNDYSLYTNGDYEYYQHAELYASSSINDNYYVKIAPASSAAQATSLGGAASQVDWGGWWGGSNLYIPNNMEAAYYWFEAGYYDNVLECEVGSDGLLTIGIRKSTTIQEDWTCIDNWKLEYYGKVTKATSISISPNTLEMAPGETHTLNFSILPSNATYKKLSWKSSNTNVATVDNNGMVTALQVGTCIITGTTIDGSNKSSTCRITVVKNPATTENIIINEIMSANVDVYLDPNKNYGSWVEVYNPSDKSVSLGGLYVSDDANNLKKNKLIDRYGAVPSHGFAILNFDHHEIWTENAYRQIDDKLDCDGGEIIISDGTNIIARQTYPQAISRCSYARKSDGGSEWSFTGTPTPGTSNQTSTNYASRQLMSPEPDQPGQQFSGSLQICVNIPDGATLVYTTDGTTPTLTNGEKSVTGIFNITQTTCYRFRLFKEGYLPSPVTTRSYIQWTDHQHPISFPIISIVTDDKHINDKEIGVFSQGPYGRPGNGQTSKCNWNMDWDRPVSFEYITEDNECVLSQECGLSTCGGWSRAWTPHAFKLKAGKEYDFQNSFQNQFFADKPFLRHKTLQIRNGGNDTGNRIKDAGIQMIVAKSGINVDYQEWQPVHVFINGSHYAVLNMREPNNKDFAYSNKGIDSDMMDQFEISPDSGYVQMRGTKESFSRLVDLSYDASDNSVYEEIKQLLDIDEYINYMAIELYSGNWDWPQNNVKGYRDQNNGKFRFVLFDLDGALSTNTPFSTFFGKEWYNFDTLHGYDYSQNKNVEGERRYLQIEFVTLFKNLLENDEFRRRFIDTFCIIGGSVFQPNHVSEIVSATRDYLASGGHVNPSGTASTLINSYNSSYNSNMVSQLKNNSHSAITSDIASLTQQSVKLSSNIKEGKIFVNGIELPYSEFNGYLFAPATFKAVAPAGYKFAGWRGNTSSNRTGTTLFANGSSWHYYDQGSLDGTNWASNVNTSWSSGLSPLGYYTSDNGNSRGFKTTLSYGNDINQKNPTYYFTKSFNLTATPNSDDEYELTFTVDDGFIVYINGTEAGRYNMPGGNVSYNSFASSYAPNNPDTGTLTLPSSLFRKGTNIIAVEVHNNNATSTDIEWDASLTRYSTGTSNYVSTAEEYSMPTSGSINLTACFEEMTDAEMASSNYHPLKVNEVSASNAVYVNDYFKRNDWIELYNPTDLDLDVAGLYVSDDINQPNKYQIPTNSLVNTIIPAKGHIIIWADKLEPQTQLHTDFKLSNTDNEMVVITSSDEFVANNQSYFKDNPSMKSFADGLTYVVHNGTETCGRYPDGTSTLYKMSRATIQNPNSILYDEKSYGTDEGISDDKEDTFTLALNEGWNWISHIMLNPIKPSVFTEVTRVTGQNSEAYNDTKYGMTGSLTKLSAGNLYKIQTDHSKSYTFTDEFCESNAPIGVRPGWNWIGYTGNGTQSVNSSLSAEQLDEGDVIMGQDGFSIYTNGGWTGTLSSIESGKGYMFKTTRTKTLQFQCSDVTVKMRRSPKHMENSYNKYRVNKYSHPNIMGLIADLQTDKFVADPERFTLLAFSGDECVGYSQVVDSLYYMTIYGDMDEDIIFKAIDQFDGNIYDIKESFNFQSEIIGHHMHPVHLTLLNVNEATSITQPDLASDKPGDSTNAKSILGYYSVDGRLLSTKAAALQRGIYIIKYNNGSHRKIQIR